MKRYRKPSDIKVGTIGYGGAFNMGKHHLTEMQKAGMIPAAVSELDPTRLEVARKDFPGIETFTSVAEMLKKSDVDLLAIITPHNTHARLALQCLNAGRHVVSEKPLAITTAECDTMIAAAKKNGVVLSTYHNRHWDGCIMTAIKILRTGVIGDISRVDVHMGNWSQPGDWWRTSKTISGGILYDWGVHMLEYTLQIMDREIAEVSGFSHTGFWAPKTKWKKDTNEDEGFAVIRYAGGACSTLLISNIDSKPSTQGWLHVTGTKGSYTMEWDHYELVTHADGKTVTTRGPNMESEGWKLYQNIADHLTKREKLIITGEWARRPIHVLDLACQSAKLGRALKAKYG